MMFIDASAIIAILAREPGWEVFATAIDNAAAPTTSPLAIYEAVAGLSRAASLAIEDARRTVDHFLDRARISIEPIDRAAGDLALSAFARYGKGRGHPAQLNLGDCFAYAMARQRGVPLLYKGEDFALTDIPDGRTA